MVLFGERSFAELETECSNGPPMNWPTPDHVEEVHAHNQDPYCLERVTLAEEETVFCMQPELPCMITPQEKQNLGRCS